MADHAIDDAAAGEGSGASHDQGDADAGIGQAALHAGEGETVVGGIDDQGIVAQAALIKRLEYLPDFLIEGLRHGHVICHVLSHSGRIGQNSRWLNVVGIDVVLGRELAVRLEKADGQPEGFGGRGLDEVDAAAVCASSRTVVNTWS